MRRALVVVAVVVLGGRVQGGVGHPQLNYKLGHGNAIAAPGTSRGTTGSIVYRDAGGILARTILAPFKMLGAPESPWQSECSESSDGRYVYCTWWVTQEDMEQYEKDAEVWRADLLTGKINAEGILEVALPSLGGDTTGFRLGLDYPLINEDGVVVKIGAAAASYKMADRTSRQLIGDATSVQVEEMTGEVESSLFSVPLTVIVLLPADLVASYQLDWNLLRYGEIGNGIDSAYHPQISRLALERMMIRFVRVGVELQIDGMSTDSTTMSVEAGLAF
jgi:hypothetical protein